jgi:hypothetical protein
MLLETRAVTVTALLLGSTWITNALVFSAILVLSLAATTWTVFRPRWPATPIVGVAAFPLDTAAGWPRWLVLLAASVPVAPLLFAGLLFARAFAAIPDARLALASNLLGAIAGGLCEYASLVLGFPALLLLALGFYALALLAWGRLPQGSPAG